MTRTNKDLTLYSGLPLSRMLGFRGLSNLFSEFDSLWREWDLGMKTFAELQPKAKFPKINVSESDHAYEVDIAVAGFDKEDISLELKENCLLIMADKKEVSEEDEKSYLIREISSRSFRRVLNFPKRVMATGITCEHRDGVVKCVLKKEPEVLPEEDVIKINIK